MSAAVSIIVPCYNVAPYLDKCMESLTLQTLGDLEIICVNDGSGDDTPAILRAWAERDGRIRVVDRENGGLSAARNTGMALAGGEYIGFVDPDDYVEHSMYGRLLEKARRSDADVTACGYTGFSDRDGFHTGKMEPVTGRRSGRECTGMRFSGKCRMEKDGRRGMEQALQEGIPGKEQPPL